MLGGGGNACRLNPDPAGQRQEGAICRSLPGFLLARAGRVTCTNQDITLESCTTTVTCMLRCQLLLLSNDAPRMHMWQLWKTDEYRSCTRRPKKF